MSTKTCLDVVIDVAAHSAHISILGFEVVSIRAFALVQAKAGDIFSANRAAKCAGRRCRSVDIVRQERYRIGKPGQMCRA
jgi:hypothetical protein